MCQKSHEPKRRHGEEKTSVRSKTMWQKPCDPKEHVARKPRQSKVHKDPMLIVKY